MLNLISLEEYKLEIMTHNYNKYTDMGGYF